MEEECSRPQESTRGRDCGVLKEPKEVQFGQKERQD